MAFQMIAGGLKRWEKDLLLIRAGLNGRSFNLMKMNVIHLFKY